MRKHSPRGEHFPPPASPRFAFQRRQEYGPRSQSHSGSAACIASPKDSKGQILDGKIRARNVGGFYPALHFGIVGLVEYRIHSRRRDFKSSMGSVNEQDPNETAKLRRAAAISRWLIRCWRQPTPSALK